MEKLVAMVTCTSASLTYVLATLAHLSHAARGVGQCKKVCPHTDSDDIDYFFPALLIKPLW